MVKRGKNLLVICNQFYVIKLLNSNDINFIFVLENLKQPFYVPIWILLFECNACVWFRQFHYASMVQCISKFTSYSIFKFKIFDCKWFVFHHCFIKSIFAYIWPRLWTVYVILGFLLLFLFYAQCHHSKGPMVCFSVFSNNANPSSVSMPLWDVQRAFDVMGPGDTVWVRVGRIYGKNWSGKHPVHRHTNHCFPLTTMRLWCWMVHFFQPLRFTLIPKSFTIRKLTLTKTTYAGCRGHSHRGTARMLPLNLAKSTTSAGPANKRRSLKCFLPAASRTALSSNGRTVQVASPMFQSGTASSAIITGNSEALTLGATSMVLMWATIPSTIPKDWHRRRTLCLGRWSGRPKASQPDQKWSDQS